MPLFTNDSSPRAETVICRLPTLTAYHCLAFPGLDIHFLFSTDDFEVVLTMCLIIRRIVLHFGKIANGRTEL